MATGPGQRGASVKDVAAAAGVSLGTVSNVLNRPDRVSGPTRARVEQAMADLGFVRNESARQLRAGQSRTARLRHARRRQPVLHRRRPRHRERGGGQRALAVPLQQQQRRRPRGRAPRTSSSSSACTGILVTPVDPDAPLLDEIARQHAARDRRPHPRRRRLLHRRRRRRRGRTAGRRAPRRPRAHAASPSSAARGPSARCGSATKAPAGPGQTPACPPTTWSRSRPTRWPSPTAGRPASGWPACPPAAAHRRLLRQRPGGARAAPARLLAGQRVPDDLAIVGFDDIDFAGGRRRAAHLRAPAAARARPGRRRAAARRGRPTRTTSTGRCRSPPSWSRAPRPVLEALFEARLEGLIGARREGRLLRSRGRPRRAPPGGRGRRSVGPRWS